MRGRGFRERTRSESREALHLERDPHKAKFSPVFLIQVTGGRCNSRDRQGARQRDESKPSEAGPRPPLPWEDLSFRAPSAARLRPFPFDSAADLEAGIPTSSILRVRNTEAQRSQVTYPKPHSRGMTTPEQGPGFPASRDRPPALPTLSGWHSLVFLPSLKRRRPSTSSPGSLLFPVPSAVSAPLCRAPVPPTAPSRCLKPRAPCRGSRGSSPA